MNTANNIFSFFGKRRRELIFSKIQRYIRTSDKIIDVGCGGGNISRILKEHGHDVTSIDIVNKSYSYNVQPIIFNGRTIPFPNKSFDVGLVCAVLHHTPQPEHLLQETARVAKRIIVLEDIYSSSIQKIVTMISDSIVNLEFVGHPHTNKTDREWKFVFNKHNLKLKSSQYFHQIFLGLPFYNAIYYLAT